MTIQDIRIESNKLLKLIDDVVTMAEKSIEEKEVLLDKKMKEYAIQGEREKKLAVLEESLKKERALIEKEKQTIHEKQILLEKKEKDLEQRISKINAYMQI